MLQDYKNRLKKFGSICLKMLYFLLHNLITLNNATHTKALILFNLGQLNNSAQSVQVLKNLSDASINPWYRLELNAYLEFTAYYFNKTKFVPFN